MVDYVYRSCVVTIKIYETRVDLLVLNMVNFEVILGKDWLTPYYDILDYHAKTMTLAMLGLPRLEWTGSLGQTLSREITFVKAQRMFKKGCLVYLSYIRDVSADTSTVNSVPVAREFPDVFPTNLMGMPPNRNIDFDIDLGPSTQNISISLDRMDPAESKELKV
ncbi:uncharacterized protein [Nicotiana tomentosiformis]|uniref:uncharacterized protein n=1 Tax=Nicotiana tomentosiformis TaxID=4098 RepID=UPI00388CDE39